MFYAAFELRCGIEARMTEYLEVQRHISDKKKRGWKIAQLARNIETAFRIGEKKAIIQIAEPESKTIIHEAQYTPVRKKAHNIAEKLGNYMHSAKRYYADDDPYWSKLEKLLIDGISELEFSTSGTLLGPPIYNPKTGESFVSMDGDGVNVPSLEFFKENAHVLIKVEYEEG